MMRCQECRVLHNTPQEASDCRYRDLLKAETRRATIAECVAALVALKEDRPFGEYAGINRAIETLEKMQ